MAIRLLPKRDIDAAKARDKAQAIAEGLKLTKRIDGLRELAADEEMNLSKFKSSTLQQIQKEIDAKIAESEALTPQLEARKKELLELAGPLDKAWMVYVKTEKSSIEATKSAYEQKLSEAIAKQQVYEVLVQEGETLKANYLEGQEQVAKERKEARKLKEEAELAASDARNKAAAVLQEAENKLIKAKKRDESSVLREQNVLIHEQTLKKKEDELEDREMKALAKELLYYSPVKASK